MQTMYHPISDHVQPAGEVVDLEELRRRRAQAQRDSLARRPEPAPERMEGAAELDTGRLCQSGRGVHDTGVRSADLDMSSANRMLPYLGGSSRIDCK